MSRHFMKLALVTGIALLAGCAHQPTQEASARRSNDAINYAQFVQNSVPWFRFTSLYSWSSSQPTYVVVWTTPNRAYRLSLMGACHGLQSSIFIGLTSQGGQVSSGRDAVIVNGQRCPIRRIDRLDMQAINAARAAQAAPATTTN